MSEGPEALLAVWSWFGEDVIVFFVSEPDSEICFFPVFADARRDFAECRSSAEG